ncbi:MAG: anion permease [Desulfovibrio sp.]|jgi:L-tartrate/succinate antiporter|nr:anion permease [Desulfovibrio sp.]
MNKQMKALLPLIVTAIVFFIPPPEGLSLNAMRYLGIFLGVVLALILEPLPGAAVGFIGVTAAAGLQLVPQVGGKAATLGSSLQWALSGFTDGTVWLIFVAYMFAMGYEKTGLGKRIALLLMKLLGGKALGLGYAAALADLVLAPFIPSNTARSGGTIYPVVKNIPPMYNSLPDSQPRLIGGYLMWTCLATTTVTSSLFYTGLAPNLLAMSLIGKAAPGVEITWMDWFLSMLPAGAILFIITPLLAYIVYPPSQKLFPETPAWAAGELSKLGGLTRKEITMALLALVALCMWIFGSKLMNATLVAIAVLCLMIMLNVVSWDDVISNKGAWNTLAWFATLVAMAGGLGRVGFLKWFADVSAGYLAGHSMAFIIFGLLVVFFFSHYFFASLTAHTTAMLPILLATAVAVPGMDMRFLGMLLAGSLGIMGIITPYGTGPSPIYYNCGYITRKDFWILGTVFGLVYFAIYAAVSMFYMPTVLS